MLDPEKALAEGREILDLILLENGFKFVAGLAAKGSGGHFARGSYVRDNRRLDLSFRFSLGMVTYHVDELSVGHTDYVRAVSGERGSYPGYSEDPLDAFRHLRDDLALYGGPFLKGSDEEFRAVVERAQDRPKGFGRLSSG